MGKNKRRTLFLIAMKAAKPRGLFGVGENTAIFSPLEADNPARAFGIFDGPEFRACRDAAAAIGAVVRAKRWCSAVDLAAICAGAAF